MAGIAGRRCTLQTGGSSFPVAAWRDPPRMDQPGPQVNMEVDRAAVTHAPTLILNQGQMVTVTVHNGLGGVTNTSLVFPGHDVTSCTGPLGVLTCEAAPGGSASYTFEATNAGTYMYHAGTDVALQVEMGIVGAIIVRPFGYDAINPTAYGHPDTAYEREYLFVLSEMDSRIHEAVEFGDSLVGTEMLGDYFSNYWFINGRTAPDTMAAPGVPWPPTQPYNILPQIHPGERLLMRVISAGRDLHPYHHHGNHARPIARDGRMLSSAPGAGADLSFEVFTIQALPGESYDAIFQWTGQDLGWDIYGTLAQGRCQKTSARFRVELGERLGESFEGATEDLDVVWAEQVVGESGLRLQVLEVAGQDLSPAPPALPE